MTHTTDTPNEPLQDLDDADLDTVRGAGIVLEQASISSMRTEQLNNRHSITEASGATALRTPADGLADYDESGPGIVHADRKG